MSLGLSTQITSQRLALSKSVEDGRLDTDSMLLKTHMSQHHDGTEEEGGWVGKCLASDIWGGAVDGLEDGALVANVGRWGKTKTTDESSAHIRQDISVKVGHNQNLVVVWDWVGDDLQARVVDELSIELDIREVLGDSLGGLEEKTIGHLHDGGLVDGADLGSANVLGILESVSADTLAGLSCDQLDALHDAINNDVLNAGVLALSVLSDQDSVDIVVWGLVACNGTARAYVGKEVECAAESKV